MFYEPLLKYVVSKLCTIAFYFTCRVQNVQMFAKQPVSVSITASRYLLDKSKVNVSNNLHFFNYLVFTYLDNRFERNLF